jgi:hypothetical protein
MTIEQIVDRAIATLPAAVRDRFPADPIGVLEDDLGLTVEEGEHLAGGRDGQACAGMSFVQDNVILYAATPHSRRANFTLAHELGHLLIDWAGLYDWLSRHDNLAMVMETLCDRIAQRLLLPPQVVDAVVGVGPPTARHLLELFKFSQASRPVCAIALANRLPGLGAVVITDRIAGSVAHASINPDAEQGWPTVFPWPGQQIPPDHPLASVRSPQTFTRKSFWRDQWGRRQEYYVDAVAEDTRRSIAVLSSLDLWGAERLHIDQPPEFDRRPTATISCCGQERPVRGWPCPTCREPYCPKCGVCRCDRQAQREQPCRRCTLLVQPHLLRDGLCDDCR